MRLDRLILRNFRNYAETTVHFSSGINQIEGGNAQGKTNLLEAVFFLSTGRSFRTVHLQELIRREEQSFSLEALFVKEGVSQTIKLSFDGVVRKMAINSTIYAGFNNLLGLLPSVLHAPEDIALITGAPSERRRFLNLLLAQCDPLYVHHLARYTRALKQRNDLLKRQSKITLESWEEALSFSAAYLTQKRKEIAEYLKTPLAAAMHSLSQGKDLLGLRYLPSPSLKGEETPTPAFFKEQFHKWRTREMAQGITLIGPHRDDLLLLVDNQPAKIFSSEGQKRCCAAALRLAEWKILKELTQCAPLLAIDDIGVHLDSERRRLFEMQLPEEGQVFLTSPLFSDKSRYTLAVQEGRLLSQLNAIP